MERRLLQRPATVLENAAQGRPSLRGLLLGAKPLNPTHFARPVRHSFRAAAEARRAERVSRTSRKLIPIAEADAVCL